MQFLLFYFLRESLFILKRIIRLFLSRGYAFLPLILGHDVVGPAMVFRNQ